MTIFDQRGQHVNVQRNSSAKPVDFLTLIGQPDNLKVNKANIRTILSIVYPHYMELFEDWWEHGTDNGQDLPVSYTNGRVSDYIDGEDSAFVGEQVYEYILAHYGKFVFENA